MKRVFSLMVLAVAYLLAAVSVVSLGCNRDDKTGIYTCTATFDARTTAPTVLTAWVGVNNDQLSAEKTIKVPVPANVRLVVFKTGMEPALKATLPGQ